MLKYMLTQRSYEMKIDISVQIENTKIQNSQGKSNQGRRGDMHINTINMEEKLEKDQEIRQVKVIWKRDQQSSV